MIPLPPQPFLNVATLREEPKTASGLGEAPGKASMDLVEAIAQLLEQTSLQKGALQLQPPGVGEQGGGHGSAMEQAFLDLKTPPSYGHLPELGGRAGVLGLR